MIFRNPVTIRLVAINNYLFFISFFVDFIYVCYGRGELGAFAEPAHSGALVHVPLVTLADDEVFAIFFSGWR